MMGRPLSELVPQHIRRFEPYTPSRPDAVLMKLHGVDRLHRLNNNENSLGPPPRAVEVVEASQGGRAAIYPSGDCYTLRHELARASGLSPDQYLVSNGANEAISIVVKAFCEPGDNIVTADRTFAVYEWVALFSGVEPRLVPLSGLTFDDRGMLDRIDVRTKVVFVCNPNNPTGTYWSSSRLRSFLDEVDGRCVVVVDEAYFEFVEKDDYPDATRLIEQYPNLVVFRTFSKMYGLAGLRIGYLAAQPELVDIIRRAYVVYSVNTVAQEAALAAVGDAGHIERSRDMVREAKAYLAGALPPMGLTFLCHEGNFVMVELPMSDTLAYRELMRRGIMVRAMTGFRFPNHVRITLSVPDVMRALVDALSEILERSRSRRITPAPAAPR